MHPASVERLRRAHAMFARCRARLFYCVPETERLRRWQFERAGRLFDAIRHAEMETVVFSRPLTLEPVQ